MTRNKLALSLAGLLLAPIAGTAFAQTAPAATQDQSQSQSANSQNTKQLQTITVTGSALPRVDTETPSPVTVITAQDIARTGFTTVSDVVRSLSADNSGSIPNSFYSGFAAGSSGVALRGLTVNSTLVLIDGKRSASYPLVDDGIRSFVDLNTIPLAAVERIEVLKDGASSIYGSDAIAGVVNIILKPSYQGVEGSADVGNTQHGGGFTKKASLVAGTGDLETDHYNTYFSVEWEQDQPIRASDRNYPFNSANWTGIGGQNTSWGNPNLNGTGVGSIWGTVAPAGTTAGGTATGPFQPLRPCGTGSTKVTVPGTGPGTGTYCEQNQVADYTYIQQKQNKGGIYGRYTYKFNDTTKAYASLSYDENKTTILGMPPQIQNSVPVNTNTIELPPTLANGQLNPNNPFASQGEYALINYAFGDIPQQTITDDHNLRAVLDLQGEWGDWNYEASLVGNHESLDYRQTGFLSYNGLINAINNGTYNFVNPSANSAAVLNSIAPPYATTDTSDMDVFDFNVNRELFDLPGGAAGFAGGVQFRHEAQDELPLNPGGIYQGLGATRIIGNRNVSGIYSEFDAPLLDTLELDASGRFDHYPGVANNFSPKVGMKWKPTDWLAVRGTYSKGFRAPAFGESAGSYSAGFTTTSVQGLGASPAFLAAHGNDAYVTNPYSIEEGSSGNPNLKPEKSQSFTFGVVVQPLSWLNASLDYYSIKKSNVILPADPGTALSQYLNTGTIPAGYTMTFDAPDPLHPNAPLRPVFVGADYINGQWLKTTGLDLDMQAHFEFSNGIKYISEVQATQIFEWKEDIGGQIQSYVGTQGPYGLSSGAGTPRTRSNWANTVEYGPLSLTATVYFTSHEYESAQDITGTTACYDALGANGGPLIPDCTMASFTYGNLVGSYQLNDHITLTGSIDNVTDRKAPLDPINYAGNGYNPTFDYAGILGRVWNLGVKVKF
ncbi:MAG TPA: TonB-dependent receptor [Dyella sp.]|uniref:TonB-dependent receptor n=1 Tax=Dyella sp. TaxID=1869338 RepID=UPI002C915C96|nr:TonB-dependent receptor [Dyella sp.]HTV85115.1 TonB-dependent receptor [Dyella sp.]